MLKMVKEIAGLCYHLDKLYMGEKDKRIKKEIAKNFELMSGLLDKAIRSQFDENDAQYKKSVRKLKKYSREIKKESELMNRYETFFSGISSLGEQLEKLVTGLK